MKYLITRCTLFDMAGCAMIEGFMAGMKRLDPSPEFGALVFPENAPVGEHEKYWDEVLTGQFLHPRGDTGSPALLTQCNEAFDWCDIAVDLGGYCHGFDPYRAIYIRMCQERKKPYMYGAQSFHNPDPKIVEGIPAVARGHGSAAEFMRATNEGTRMSVGADLMFLVEPVPLDPPVDYDFVFTTHEGKPWDVMGQYVASAKNPVQVVLKPDKEGEVFEPLLYPQIPVFIGSPSQIIELVRNAKEVHTSRYHTAVAGHYWGIKVHTYVNYPTKYEDLHYGVKECGSLERLEKIAMKTCDMAYELCHSHS